MKIMRQTSSLSLRDSRQGFIRKVYTIVSLQLLTTASVSYLFMKNRRIARRIMLDPSYSWLLPSSFLISLGSLFSLQSKLRFNFPINYLLLGVFTLCQSLSVGTLVSFYRVKEVLLATLQTGIAVLGLTLYAFQPNPKFDLTPFGSSLFVGLLLLLSTSILSILFPQLPMNQKVLSAGGAFLMGLFLVYDTQLIVGGKHKKGQIDRKDHILGAVHIYMDIINLFVYILRLVGTQGNSNDD